MAEISDQSFSSKQSSHQILFASAVKIHENPWDKSGRKSTLPTGKETLMM